MRLAVIGGTAVETLALRESREEVSDTPWGAATLLRGHLDDTELVFLNRHGPAHRLPPHRVNYRANIAALKALEVDAVIAVNTVGGIAAGMTPGTWVVPHQLIDYTWGRSHSFWDGEGETMLHVDFTQPYTEALRAYVLACAAATDVAIVDGGVMGVTQGPRLETPAEISRMERDGCHLVGMTGMPEAALAREAGLAYVSLGLVVNPAAGRGVREITLDEIRGVIAAAQADVRRLLERFCRTARLDLPVRYRM